MADLKVFMMGGRRCGKTSALASMFHQVRYIREIYQLLNVNDRTILVTKQNVQGKSETQESLNDKIQELREFLSTYNPNDFLVDKGPTRMFWDYVMQVTLTGTKKTMRMNFRDAAGEFFDYGGKYTQEVSDYVAECDVYIVVIDTPYLMAEDSAVYNAANITDSIFSFLSAIDATPPGRSVKENAKCILFVPIKCEKWLHSGEIDKVNAKIKEVYASTISLLEARQYTEIDIIPIETAGDIEYTEMREPYLLTTNNTKLTDKFKGKKQFKCSKITSRQVSLSNGEPYKLIEGDILNPDPEGVFKFDDETLDIVRPACWFRHKNNEPQYHPKNCEQITLHILRFMFTKAKKNQCTGFFDWLKGILGYITIDDLNKTLVEISNRGLIKENVDGIERIKRYF